MLYVAGRESSTTTNRIERIALAGGAVTPLACGLKDATSIAVTDRVYVTTAGSQSLFAVARR